jgi:uncharacterized protein YjbI with pentapeptide repeats
MLRPQLGKLRERSLAASDLFEGAVLEGYLLSKCDLNEASFRNLLVEGMKILKCSFLNAEFEHAQVRNCVSRTPSFPASSRQGPLFSGRNSRTAA